LIIVFTISLPYSFVAIMSSSLHLDHIVLLIPYATLLSPPSWLTENFTLTPGGTHSDNKTANKLIVFADGSYVELIAFIDDLPTHREGHKWDKPFGIVDFALTTKEGADENWKAVNGRLKKLGGKVGYENPLAGGRLRPDGKEVKWHVTNPTGVVRGEVPFFCHDVTDRELRVPTAESSIVHPSGVFGVKEIGIYVPDERVDELRGVYGSLFDVEAKDGAVETGPLKGNGGKVRFYVGNPKEEWKIAELEKRDGVFIGDLVFGASGGKEKRKERIDGEVEEVGFGGLYIS